MSRSLFVLVLLLMLSLSSYGCGDGNQGTDGDENECPIGQEIGPDGKCHTVVDGDLDGVVPDGDKETTDGDKDVDSSDVDDSTDGDVIDEDLDVDDNPVDGDNDFEAEEKPDGDIDEMDAVDADDDFEILEPDADPELDIETVDADPEVEEVEINPNCVEGSSCDINEDCGFGCYCADGPGKGAGTCTADCAEGTEFLCDQSGLECCDYSLGLCVECAVDGDAEPDAEEPTFCTSDVDCDPFWYCNPLKQCEQGECTIDDDCKTSEYCTEHGRCLPIPELDDDDEVAQKANITKCDVNSDCQSGFFCHWKTSTCVPGCQSDADCLIDAPKCKEGICY